MEVPACRRLISEAATRFDTSFAGPLPACDGTTDDAMTQSSTSATARPVSFLRRFCGLVLCLLLAACASTPPSPGGSDARAGMLSITPFLGDWHVAAYVPWFGERGRVAARFHFAAQDADATRVTITRSWRDGFSEPIEFDRSTARRDGPGGRLWKVRAWRVFPTRLRVLEAADDGSWLLLDSADRDHAWILTRALVVEDEAYLELERRIRGHGVNTDKLRRVAQVPEQEGRLGFELAASPSPGR